MWRWKVAWGLSGVLVVGLADGATLTWDGGGATDALSDPLNWSPDQAPGLSDDLLIGLNASPFSTANLTVGSITAERTGLRNGQPTTFSDPAVSFTIETLGDLDFETLNNSNAQLTIDGVAGAGQAATPGLRVGGDLTLGNTNGGTGDARLVLNSVPTTGGTTPREALVRIDGRAEVRQQGSIEGEGVVLFGPVVSPSANPALNNEGLIFAREVRPTSFNPPPPPPTELLLVAADADRPLDLDGLNEQGVVEVGLTRDAQCRAAARRSDVDPDQPRRRGDSQHAAGLDSAGQP